jgi:hypothetical protein
METLLEFAGSPANRCDASATHTPVPLRFVWHHIQPQEAGGQTVSANLVQVCDSCHYTIHRLMWVMRLVALQLPVTDVQKAYITKPPRRAQLVLAGQGYEACRIAGTIDKIPNEG